MIDIEKLAAKKTIIQQLGKKLEMFAGDKKRSRLATDILAHELGHAKAFGKSGPAMKRVRMGLYSHGSNMAQLVNLANAGKAGKFSKSRALTQLAGETPRLLEEAAATMYGLKAMRGLKYISPTQYKNAKSNLYRAFGTYATGAASRTIGSGLSPKIMPTSSTVAQAAVPNISSLLGQKLSGLLITGVGKNKHILQGARGGSSTRRQARALAKAMGSGKIAITRSGKTRAPGNAFQMDSENVRGLGGRLMLLKDLIGKRGMKRARRHGIVSAPGVAKSELLGGKKGLTEKTLDGLERFARNMQK